MTACPVRQRTDRAVDGLAVMAAWTTGALVIGAWLIAKRDG